MRAVIEQAAQGCRTLGTRLETIQGSSLGGLMGVTAMTHSIMKVSCHYKIISRHTICL